MHPGIEPIRSMFGIAACVFQKFYTVVGNESALALIISQQVTTLCCAEKMVGGEVIETPSAAYKTAVINQYTNRP